MRLTEALPHPPDWGATTVARGIDVKRGVSWSKDQEHEESRNERVPVIRISNVQERLELTDLLYLSGVKPAAVAAKRVASGWTIIVGSNGNRARIGNAVLVRDDTPFLFASFLVGARPKNDSGLSPEYFYRWLSSEPVQAYLSASSEGTTGLSNLSHSFFRAMTISVPPPDEQAALARILTAIDETLELTHAAVARAKEARRAIVQRVLSEGLRHEPLRKTAIGLVPSSWDVVPVSSVVETFQYGLSVPMQIGGTLPILRMGNIQDGEVLLFRSEIRDPTGEGHFSVSLEARGRAVQPNQLARVGWQGGHLSPRDPCRLCVVSHSAGSRRYEGG